MKQKPAIEVLDLTRRFGEFVAVDRVTFDVRPGEIFGYLGANGAGKSTTIRILCGLLLPSSGSASVAGTDVSRDPEKVRRLIGYMSQKFSLYLDLQVMENLEFFGGAYGLQGKVLHDRSLELLHRVELADQQKAMTGDLPGGFRQRLALACALLHKPQVLFLDEPTAGVDPASRRSFWRLIREMSAGHTTIFVTTHYMDEAEYCDRVGMMVDGALVALDTPAGLKRTFTPGDLFQVRGVDRRSGPKLLALPGVDRVESVGDGFHMRTEPGVFEEETLQRRLFEIGLEGGKVSRVESTLEDVFLEVVGKNRRRDGFADTAQAVEIG